MLRLRLLVNLTMFLVVVFFLSACGGMLGDGRMEANREVRLAEEATNQKLLETKQVEIQAKATKKTNPTVRTTTSYHPDGSLASVTTEVDVAPSIEAATGGQKFDSTYGVDTSRTPTPKGEFAENIKATGEAVSQVGNTPAAMVLATGYATKEVAELMADSGPKIDAESVNLENSLNDFENHATGYGNSSVLDGTAKPTVVNPVVVQ